MSREGPGPSRRWGDGRVRIATGCSQDEAAIPPPGPSGCNGTDSFCVVPLLGEGALAPEPPVPSSAQHGRGLVALITIGLRIVVVGGSGGALSIVTVREVPLPLPPVMSPGGSERGGA